MAIGVFDSGLGGLTVLKSLQRALPDQAFVYLGDHAHAPYGVRDPESVIALTAGNVQWLWNQGCDLVVLACNTASAIALRPIQESGVPQGKNVLGVFVPMIEALTERPWGDKSAPKICEKTVALFATPATVASRAFQRELAIRAMGVDVEAQACGGLVQAIECGDQAHISSLVREHVTSLHQRLAQPDCAILACTHYPWAISHFRSYLGDDVKILDQAELVAASLQDYLIRHPNYRAQGRAIDFVTTGLPIEVSQSASALWGSDITFKTVQID